MKILYKISTFLILALGLLHISMTPVLFHSFSSAALWFVSGGVVIVFLSFFNFLLMSEAGKQRLVIIFTHIANLIGLAFGSGMFAMEALRGRPGPSSWAVLALLIFETVAAYLRSR